MDNNDQKNSDDEEMINKVVEMVSKYDFYSIAILLLESSKPLVFIGGEMGRFFLTPFIMAFGEDLNIRSQKFFEFIENRNNIEKIILRLEEKARQKDKNKANN